MTHQDSRIPTSQHTPSRHDPDTDKPIMRSLGEFFGHVWNAVTHDPTPTERRRVLRRVEERTVESAEGTVTLRRTIVEEIELPKRLED